MLSGLTVLIALICVLLTAVVLIQNPKGGGIDSTFGGSANQMFGAAKQADFIERLTWGLGIALFVLCIITAVYVAGSSGVSVEGGADLPPLDGSLN